MEFATKPKQYGSRSVARMTPEQIAEATTDGNLDDLINHGIDCDLPIKHKAGCSKPDPDFANYLDSRGRRLGDPEPPMCCPECGVKTTPKEA
jgi:hypothetical protein